MRRVGLGVPVILVAVLAGLLILSPVQAAPRARARAGSSRASTPASRASSSGVGGNVSSVSGGAVGVQASVLGASVIAPEPQVTLPALGGGPFEASRGPVGVPGVVGVGPFHVSTGGVFLGTLRARASSSAESKLISLAGGLVKAAGALSRCDSGVAGSTGSSTVRALTVAGTSITTKPAPNTTIPLPGGSLVLNEQVHSDSVGSTMITVNAIHLTLLTGTEVIVSQSRCGANGISINIPPPGPVPTVTMSAEDHRSLLQGPFHHVRLRIGAPPEGRPLEVPMGPQRGPRGLPRLGKFKPLPYKRPRPARRAHRHHPHRHHHHHRRCRVAGDRDRDDRRGCERLADRIAGALKHVGADIARATDPVATAASLPDYTTSLGNLGLTIRGRPDEPSVAADGRLVFETGNTWAAFSSDGGQSFTAIDPTTIFRGSPLADPNNPGQFLDGGMCCDQLVRYIPSIDRFVWLIQYLPNGTDANGNLNNTGINTLVIAEANPTDLLNSGGTCCWTADAGTSGTWYSSDFGLTNASMDYPSMSFSDNFLYISFDVAVGDAATGEIVFRLPLSYLANDNLVNSPTEYTVLGALSPAVADHLAQGSRYGAYLAAPLDNSDTRVFYWPDNSPTATSFDVPIDSWCNSDYDSNEPDDHNWLGYEDGRTYAAMAPDQHDLTIAWGAGDRYVRNGYSGGCGFDMPHINLVDIDTDTQTVNWSDYIAYSNIAVGYPAIAYNNTGELGLSFGFGGYPYYASSTAEILNYGSFVTEYSTRDDGLDRWGDYVDIQPNGRRDFAVSGYSTLASGYDPLYTQMSP